MMAMKYKIYMLINSKCVKEQFYNEEEELQPT